MQRDRLRDCFEQILSSLREDLEASRTTLRIDIPRFDFHVDDPAGEARKAGVPSLVGQTALDQRSLSTVKWMEERGDYLVQATFEGAEPAPPQALIDIYGVRAQMLGPILRERRLAGWISVHENSGPRDWSENDVDQLKEAVGKVQSLLDEMEEYDD